MIALHSAVLAALLFQGPPAGPPAHQGTLPAALQRAERVVAGSPVETEMRHVHYRASAHVAIAIHYLRGRLLPAQEGASPWLEDRESFTLEVDTASLSVDGDALAAMLNEQVMNYPGAPLRAVHIRVRPEGLDITGHLHGIAFAMVAVPTLTADGRIRLSPASVKVAGIGVRGLMRRLGIALDDVMKVRQGRGIAVRERDMLLTAGALVPPPRLHGRVVAIGLAGGRMQIVYGKSARGVAPPLAHAGPPGRNYVCYHGGVLRFGKLTMSNAALEIVDADEGDPFDLSLPEFNRQLVAGATHNQPDFGLKTTLPDYDDLPAQPAQPAQPAHPERP